MINFTAVRIRMHYLMRCCDDREVGFRVGRSANIDAASGCSQSPRFVTYYRVAAAIVHYTNVVKNSYTKENI